MKRAIITVLSLVAMICILSFVSPVFAQDAEPVIAPSSMWFEIWRIVQPVAVVFSSTVFPPLVAVIAFKVTQWLGVKDESERLKVQAQLNAALHQSASNALKYALTKYGASGAIISDLVMSQAVQYVTTKNPETLEKLGVTEKALKDIILSKAPDTKPDGI